MKKLYAFLAGATLVSFGSVASGSVAQMILQSSSVPTQPTLQTQATPRPTPSPTCSLQANIAITFKDSQCREITLAAPKTYYRYYSGDNNRFGRYLSTDLYVRNVDAIRNLALKQEWGNHATMRLTVTVPAGTKVYEGVVAPQDPASCYVGGGQQTFIENTRDPNLVWSAGTPMQVETFQCP